MSTNENVIKRSKADIQSIIDNVQQIINECGTAMSLRQIYYQLVIKHIIPNNINEYKKLSGYLVTARKNGKIDYDDMEDRTRKSEAQYSESFNNIVDEVEATIDCIRGDYRFPLCLYQPILHIIGLEKQALETFFTNLIPYESNTILVVCRGYNSLTQIHELAETIKEFKMVKRIHCSYFGDFDPTGLDIERNFEDQMADQGVQFTTFKRIGITKFQIITHKLPDDPAKGTDSRTKNWTLGGCVELDALPPKILEELIKDQINKYWDQEIAKEVEKLKKVLDRRYKKKLIKRIRQEFKV